MKSLFDILIMVFVLGETLGESVEVRQFAGHCLYLAKLQPRQKDRLRRMATEKIVQCDDIRFVRILWQIVQKHHPKPTLVLLKLSGEFQQILLVEDYQASPDSGEKIAELTLESSL